LLLANQALAIKKKKIKCAGGAKHKVHLTFDDGPKIPETLKILDSLKKFKPSVKATFFITTTHFDFVMKKEPSQYSRSEKAKIAVLEIMKQEGHTFGSHSHVHLDHAGGQQNSRREINQNLERNNAIWKKLKLPKPAPFRFPYGAGWFKNQSSRTEKERLISLKAIKENGFVPLHWDIDSWDWSKYKRKALPDSVLQQICTHKGGVALFHDIQSSTAENIGLIMESIKASGHELVSYNEIKTVSDRRDGGLLSFGDSAASLFYCNKKVSAIDQAWETCEDLNQNSYDYGGSRAIQSTDKDGK